MSLLKFLIVKDNFFEKVKKFFSKPSNFLKQGLPGGLISLGLLEAFVIYFVLPSSYAEHLEIVFWGFLAVLISFLLNEILNFIFKIIFKSKNRQFVYFTTTFVMFYVELHYFISGSLIVPCYALIIFSIIVIDVFGICVWNIFKKKNRKNIWAYICTFVCAAYISSIMYIVIADNFLKSFIPQYFELYKTEKVLTQNEKDDFEKYFSKGALTVKTVDYAPFVENGIATSSINLFDFAGRSGKYKKKQEKKFGFDLDKAPVAGRIWYPEEKENCPALFIVHGNHDFTVPSHLGYEYLGTYLASNGYVVVSIDETYLNDLWDENDARAIMILENIKTILLKNSQSNSRLYNKIDPSKIAIAGHSRGGESVATAYLFNSLKYYPDNGNIKFDYNYDIKSVIAIAPTVDQYMPASHAVQIENVNYLVIHGSDDADVSFVEGKKQYENVNLTNADYFKSRVYVMGANHGQFNSLWGRYDDSSIMKHILSTSQLISMEEQQRLCQIYIKAFLDATLLGNADYKDLFYAPQKYFEVMPETVYQTVYESGSFEELIGFDEDVDLIHGKNNDIRILCKNVSLWKEKRECWSNGDKENFLLYLEWNEENTDPSVEFKFPSVDFSNKVLSLKIADGRNNTYSTDGLKNFSYSLLLKDVNDNTVHLENVPTVLPSIVYQLYKSDVFVKYYSYKHEMQTILLNPLDFEQNSKFDFSKVCSIKLEFMSGEFGSVYIDGIGFDVLNKL